MKEISSGKYPSFVIFVKRTHSRVMLKFKSHAPIFSTTHITRSPNCIRTILDANFFSHLRVKKASTTEVLHVNGFFCSHTKSSIQCTVSFNIRPKTTIAYRLTRHHLLIPIILIIFDL